MIYPSKKEFIDLSKKGNLIPVYKEIVADMETPVSAYKKIESEYSFLLESVEGGEKQARYSFLGSCPKERLFKLDSINDVRKILGKYKLVELPNLPTFCGGLVGYIGYDAVREIEKLPNKNPDDLKFPVIQFMLADTLLVFDHLKHKIVIIANAYVEGNVQKAYKDACLKIEKIQLKLKKPIKLSREEFEIPTTPKKSLKVRSNLTKAEYEAMVLKAKEYIKAGDIIQVVPSQRFETKCTAAPLDVYRVLRIINPSPYMYYLRMGELSIVGSSPEVMVRLEKGKATLRPIAGTRRRGKDEDEEAMLSKELLASTKEKAEHIMLVDLGRNDLGRVCDYGSVKVTECMTIEKYSHVMHIVSNVSGKLRSGKDAVDLFRAAFPAGTVSGAPKVRAMEIIDELENVRRGIYAGTVGYFSFNGDLDSGIAIRTILIHKGKAYVQAGGGVVADSDPEEEYNETVNKAKALLSAIELANA